MNTKCIAMEILKRALDIPVGTSPLRGVLQMKKKQATLPFSQRAVSMGTERNREAEPVGEIEAREDDAMEFKTLWCCQIHHVNLQISKHQRHLGETVNTGLSGPQEF